MPIIIITILNACEMRIDVFHKYKESVRNPSIKNLPVPSYIRYVAVVVPTIFDL